MAKHSVCKITLLFLALFTFSSGIYAQNATKILDTAAAKYKKAGGVKINYKYTLGSEHGTGVLKSDGTNLSMIPEISLCGLTGNPFGLW